ncbi:Prefoldin [Myriangium duriaei CBS 260.36]|uniref:Prefoldin n=1 Tax=Myriangium duriaei CBS 260.36 TaxID=1168546 RepID=A0A9P4J6Z2_9PEZI|nr:Prefoldin [Myriangium duriaei CBS 260.36]
MSLPNEALQKLLLEIEQKASFAQQQMVIVKSQIDSSKREIRMIDLMNTEISSLPQDAKLYEGVGKMFVATPTATVNTRLAKDKEDLNAKLANLDKKYTFLETTYKNSQDHLDKVFKNGGR